MPAVGGRVNRPAEAPASPTKGNLNVDVNPGTASVTVAGPVTRSFTGSQLLVDLPPGRYTVTARAMGYTASTAVDVVAGETRAAFVVVRGTRMRVTALIGGTERSISNGTGYIYGVGSGNTAAEFEVYDWLNAGERTVTFAVESDGASAGGVPVTVTLTPNRPRHTLNIGTINYGSGFWISPSGVRYVGIVINASGTPEDLGTRVSLARDAR